MNNPIGQRAPGDVYNEIGSAALASQQQQRYNTVKSNVPSRGTDIMYPGSGVAPRIVVAGTGWSLKYQGFEEIDGEPWYKVVISGTSAGIGQVDFFFESLKAFAADSLTMEFMCDQSRGGQFNANLSVDNNFSTSPGVFTNNRLNFTPSNSDPLYHNGLHAINFERTGMSVQGASFVISDAEPIIGKLWTGIRIRRTGITSYTGDVTTYLRSVKAGVNRRKGRLCVIADDGYHSFVRLGAPMLARYDIPSTMAIIASGVGVNSDSPIGTATLKELQEYVAAGNFCVAHGTNTGDINLFSGTFAGGNEKNPIRIADMNRSRDYLLKHGLTDDLGAQCYVWPQGIWSSGGGDTSLLQEAYNAGYRLGRAATQYQALLLNFGAMSPKCLTRMATQIIGHTYAGLATTPDDATETTNVNNIISTINNVAAGGSDAFLMLHRVVARGGATAGAGTIEIETDRLAAICAAIQAKVAAGTLECVGMPEFLL